MTKSPEEVEREVEAARERIDQTVEALKDKLQPQELFDEATRIMGQTSNKVLTTVVEQAKANPLPIALIGVGVAWWALSQNKKSEYDPYSGQSYYETYEGYDEDGGVARRLRNKAREAAMAAKASLSGAKEKVAGAVAHASAEAGARAGVAKGKISEIAGTAQAKAGEAGRHAQQRLNQAIDTQPLILAGIGLAVGAAIGASLPASRLERRYVGPVRNKAMERGREVARTSLDDAKSLAQRAYDQAKDELHRQTGPEGEGLTLREKAKAVADAGAQTVRDEVGARLQ